MSTQKFLQGEQGGVSSMSVLPPMTAVRSFNPGLRIHLFKANDASNLECFSFEDDLTKYGKCIMTQMVVPKFFNGMTQEVRGNFLLRIEEQSPLLIEGIFREKRLGKEGCGYSFVLSSKGMFQFNGFTYHPFILRSLTVCYFATETDSVYDKDWRNSTDVGVAIESDLVYDHRLDLFITSHAELRPII